MSITKITAFLFTVFIVFTSCTKEIELDVFYASNQEEEKEIENILLGEEREKEEEKGIEQGGSNIGLDKWGDINMNVGF